MRNAAAGKLLATASSTGLSLTDDGFAEYMDSNDSLKEHRASFHFPKQADGRSFTYLCGNSLGLQHVDVDAKVNGFLKKWREQAVEGHFMQPNPWFETQNVLRKDMASIVGASESEVVIMNALTVNLHLLMAAFYKPHGSKRKILMENHGFPSDTHALCSQLEVHGFDPATDLLCVGATGVEDWSTPPSAIANQAIISTIERRSDEIAIVVISAIHFLTGQLFDIPAIVKAAHAKNIVIGVDCAHAVGNVPLQLHDWDVDFAVWCTYKYLNSGPSNIGGAFVHHKHTLPGSKVTYLKGWWGRERKQRFTLHHEFEPEEGAAAFQISCCPPHSIMMLAPSLTLMAKIGINALREKSLHLTAYLELLLNALIPAGCIEIITPVDPEQRGAQLSVRIKPNKLKSDYVDSEGYECGLEVQDSSDAEIMQRQLLDAGVIVDKRPPDIIRIAPAPLYNNYQDVLHAVRIIQSLF